jgi:hypothetical protein
MIGVVLSPLELARRDRSVALTRGQLGETAFATASTEGASMSVGQVVAWALKEDVGA